MTGTIGEIEAAKQALEAARAKTRERLVAIEAEARTLRQALGLTRNRKPKDEKKA